jgi:hypothetical protein
MSFAAPQILTLLFLLPLLWLYLVFLKKRPYLFFNLKPNQAVKQNTFNFIFTARALLICLIFALLIFALARPQWPRPRGP